MLKQLHDEICRRPYVLENRNMLNGLMNDCIYGDVDSKAKIRQMLVAYDCGIVNKLLSDCKPDDIMQSHFLLTIKNNSGYDEKICRWILDSWLLLINIETKKAWDQFLVEKTRNELKATEKKLSINISTSIPSEQSPSLPQMYIPCGVGNDDYGFSVYGIKKESKCNISDESIYAVVFNYLQRNSTIDEKSDKPLYIKNYEEDLTYELDYRIVYRLMMVMLLMIKNNCLKDGILSFNYIGDMRELKAAYLCLNHYLAFFSRLAGLKSPLSFKCGKVSSPTMSLNGERADIYVKNLTAKTNERIAWGAKRINYKVTDIMKDDFEYLLREISPFSKFNSGQYEALKLMLSKSSHTICILPTGAGKSLIYYMCAILQPGSTFIISPTELLIMDQCDNLNKFHHFDDVRVLRYTGERCFVDLKLTNKLFYLTPETFQNRDLLKEFIVLNSIKEISGIILDEVHCISNWSHDFRPEYLMLSAYLNRYLDRTYFKCFTATANYTVIKDIKNQLRITDDEDIISPVKLEKENIRYSFVPCSNINMMVEKSLEFLRKNLTKGQKTIVFVKRDSVSQSLYENLDDIKYEAAVFNAEDKTAYRMFAEDKCKILITNEELGIGVNLSDVHNVLHFGLPISKGEYVQQIGRAGRNGEKADSLVVFLECDERNINNKLLLRTVSTEEIISVLNTEQDLNDYSDVYRVIIGHMKSKEIFLSQITNIYSKVNEIKSDKEFGCMESVFPIEEIKKAKICLYVLFAIGYVSNWSFCGRNETDKTETILIGTEPAKQSLSSVKDTARNYLYLVGGNKKSIALVGTAGSVEEIIRIYVDWYFDNFIYHHKEQFLDMLALFESYKTIKRQDNFSKEINKRLAAYFSLSMLEISRDEAKYTTLSYINIAQTVIEGIDYSTVSNVQRINQDSNNIKLDFLLFVYSFICEDEYDSKRMKRILGCLDDSDLYDFFESISLVYSTVPIENRLLLFNDLDDFVKSNGISYGLFFDAIYLRNEKDIIFYGVIAYMANMVFEGEKDV